jgi:DNA-binding GntR family transcriptional regulator
MFVIAHVLPTDYSPSDDRQQLQEIADDLNRDAIAAEEKDRWIVVNRDIHQALLKIAN